ncbi:hypothetical protein AB0M48_22365 [Lentzea sp. NPDC051208]|uniref:hypothetical protein n=1 Tax=Lentzea sp. NPDC051208 TaxID=3154642 RepID=UPI003428A147
MPERRPVARPASFRALTLPAITLPATRRAMALALGGPGRNVPSSRTLITRLRKWKYTRTPTYSGV